ncbi:MAG TPA: hypothetical protein VEN28_07800 [Burkholderiaceae bacterium]|nr:hypothetical protein [Burkholderiaceae bacterium]
MEAAQGSSTCTSSAIVEQGVLGRIVAVMGSATFVKPDEYFADAP